MKRGFTMIELIFVIVILGILAAVAIPRLAATRDDAVTATIKADITTATSAIPAWYQGQKEADIQNAIQIDTTRWELSSGDCQATYTDDAGDTVEMGLYDSNDALLTNCPENNATALGASPYLKITYNVSGNGIVDTLTDDLKMEDKNITLGGNRVKW